ncbi:Bax inhibitor-1/YccA family protein [Aquisalimonas lutea]|uniref:Bax inhibitor-1/YccA family protein n=1 Tax=Aquisalimonas lutea TaxID=1327750 RepID=UPI0025B620F6|nr:Bax inhibitor-1/YccA family protein [Aquisalimonas lutea]MDN3518591.1 Bax inhibitor-1/YccA family protein [Aquisalimonas lutea]
MTSQERVISSAGARSIETNKVIRNTYTLLSLTLAFSAVMAGVAMITNAPPMHWLLVLGGYFGLLFLTNYLRNSVWGLASVFALTGFMGFTLGPIIGYYLTAVSNGPQIVLTAFGGTAAIFLGLSAYALTTRKDFSFMGGFLFAGILVGFLAGLGAMVFQLPGMMLGVSALFVLLMSAFILYQTSALVHGGETNYIMATVGLYIAIYNLFTSLLHLLMAFSGNE